jgi:hypothetical protein
MTLESQRINNTSKSIKNNNMANKKAVYGVRHSELTGKTYVGELKGEKLLNKTELIINEMKVVKWFNAKTGETLYGVDIKVNGKWHHMKDGDEEPFYKTEHEAAQKIKQMYFGNKK